MDSWASRSLSVCPVLRWPMLSAISALRVAFYLLHNLSVSADPVTSDSYPAQLNFLQSV